MKLTSSFRCAPESGNSGCILRVNERGNVVSNYKRPMIHGLEELEQVECKEEEETNKCKEKQIDNPLSRRRKSTICVSSSQTSSLTKRSKSTSDLLAFAVATVNEDDLSSVKEIVFSNRDSVESLMHDKEETAVSDSKAVCQKNTDANEQNELNCPSSLKPNISQADCPDEIVEHVETPNVEPTVGPMDSPTLASSKTPSLSFDSPSQSSSFHLPPKAIDLAELDPLKCSDIAPLSPDAYIQKLFQSMLGYEPTPRPTLELSSLPYNSTRQPFIAPITEEHMANYDLDVVSATRENNLSLLQELFSQGRSLSCCNRYGESLLHMACRRGFEEIVTFLMQDAGVEIRITDDCGRTPLHDALWNRDCQYGIVDGLVRTDPSLLLLCDKRGHTPFEYARREHWDLWKQFLWDRREHMMQALDMEVMELFRLKI